jgi:acyl-CoA thioesterase FadM
MEISFDYSIEPRFSDFDLYGIAHHSRYFYWFEEARFYFMKEIMDMTSDEVAELG